MTHEIRRRAALSGQSAATDQSQAGLRVRETALDILLEVEYRGGYADALLGRRIIQLRPDDRRLATRLVLGTLAWRARLDYEIAHYVGRDLAGIQPRALEILRMGLLQLRFFDRVPPHAVVSTSVELAKHRAESRVAAGFINAVMRRATREAVALPVREQDPVEYLSVTYSHPRWLAQRMLAWFGVEAAERLMAADNEAASNTIRLNLSRASREQIIDRLASEGFKIGAFGYAPETIVLGAAARFDSNAYRDGLFMAQSEASQLAARMLAPRAGATIVDLAAAPGGKATHLAELAGAGARIIACDRHHTGLKSVRALARRLHHANLHCVRADSAAAVPLRALSADYVMLDAPCTGIGTLREHPEIRWRLDPGDFARMAEVQARMLANAAAIVRSGGAIVYSVCSFAPEEGEGVVHRFVDANPEFEIDRDPPIPPAARDLIGADGFMRTRPDADGLDGFFAARIVRRSAASRPLR